MPEFISHTPNHLHEEANFHEHAANHTIVDLLPANSDSYEYAARSEHGHTCTANCEHTQSQADTLGDNMFGKQSSIEITHGEDGHICTTNCEHTKQNADTLANDLFTGEHSAHGEHSHTCDSNCEHVRSHADTLADDMFHENTDKHVAHGEHGHTCTANCEHTQSHADTLATSLFDKTLETTVPTVREIVGHETTNSDGDEYSETGGSSSMPEVPTAPTNQHTDNQPSLQLQHTPTAQKDSSADRVVGSADKSVTVTSQHTTKRRADVSASVVQKLQNTEVSETQLQDTEPMYHNRELDRHMDLSEYHADFERSKHSHVASQLDYTPTWHGETVAVPTDILESITESDNHELAISPLEWSGLLESPSSSENEYDTDRYEDQSEASLPPFNSEADHISATNVLPHSQLESVQEILPTIQESITDETKERALVCLDTLLNSHVSQDEEQEPSTKQTLRRQVIELADILAIEPDTLLELLDIPEEVENEEALKELTDLQYEILLGLKQSISLEDSSEFSLSASSSHQTVTNDSILRILSQLALGTLSVFIATERFAKVA